MVMFSRDARIRLLILLHEESCTECQLGEDCDWKELVQSGASYEELKARIDNDTVPGVPQRRKE
jgi:hypothetical protein